MKFVLGVLAGAFLTLTVYKGWPYVIRFDDLPDTPVDWVPRNRHWTNGVEDDRF